MLAGDDSLFVFSDQVSHLFGPLEHTAFAYTFVFRHTADSRRPALLEFASNPTNSAFEKASSLQTEGHAKLPRNLFADDSGEAHLNERERASVNTILKIS